MARLALMFLFLFLAGASPASASPKAAYRCDDGTRVGAEFIGGPSTPGSVVLKFGSKKALTLPQVPSADGGRYADDEMEFWIKGRSATLTRGGKSITCATTGN